MTVKSQRLNIGNRWISRVVIRPDIFLLLRRVAQEKFPRDVSTSFFLKCLPTQAGSTLQCTKISTWITLSRFLKEILEHSDWAGICKVHVVHNTNVKHVIHICRCSNNVYILFI